MNRALTFTTGLGLGVGLMYLMDPSTGGRRRALIRDRGIRLGHDVQDMLGKNGRDLRNRARGAVAVSTRFARPSPDDATLEERVRAKLGRWVSHPRAIQVTAVEGVVVLSGPILSGEVADLLRAVESVPGVRSVDDRLEVHESAENLPALQGGSRPPGERPEWARRNWTPALRLGAVLTGALLLTLIARGRSEEPEDVLSELAFAE